MHRIDLADDHPIVFSALRDALPPFMRVVAECFTAASTLEAVRANTSATHPVTLVLDLHLPGSGITVLQELRNDNVPAHVLVLSAEDECVGGARALRAGANGYVSKTTPLTDVVHAIGMVARGKRFFRHASSDEIEDEPLDDIAMLGSLTDREYGVLKGLAEGRTNGEIAFDLAMTPKSVSACRNRLMRRLGLPNLPALIAFARANHIIKD